MSKKEKIEQLNFQIKKKENELNKMVLSFVHNPQISILSRELVELKEEKHKLEEDNDE